MVEQFDSKTTLTWVETFYDQFSLFIGVGKRFSIKSISDATGIPEKTLNNYSQKITTPQFENLIKLCAVLPRSFSRPFIEMLGGGQDVQELRDNVCNAFDELKKFVAEGKI